LWNMAPSLLAIVGVVGLILGILPPETISRLVGDEAGLMATAAAAVFGALTLIPALVSFPLAGSLMQKGARLSNIVIFLGAWAAIKIPQLIAEAQFLGPEFTALRIVLTLSAVILIGQIIERLAGFPPLWFQTMKVGLPIALPGRQKTCRKLFPQ
ncbi:MAG: permease, partial [Bacillota bacterium]